MDLSFREYIKLINEVVSLGDDGKAKFDYSTRRQLGSMSTGFGKDHLKQHTDRPSAYRYQKRSKATTQKHFGGVGSLLKDWIPELYRSGKRMVGDHEVRTYGIYRRDGIQTEVLDAIKKMDVDDPDMAHFIRRSAIYGAIALNKMGKSFDAIMNVPSRSDVSLSFAMELADRLNGQPPILNANDKAKSFTSMHVSARRREALDVFKCVVSDQKGLKGNILVVDDFATSDASIAFGMAPYLLEHPKVTSVTGMVISGKS